MASFELPLPNELSRHLPLEGLSLEARMALSQTAMGPSAAELLLDGPAPDDPNKLIGMEQASAELVSFAAQLFPEEGAEEARERFANSFKVEWDDEKNEAAIWHIDPETGEADPALSLSLANWGLRGCLQLPSALRIAQLDCSYNEITSISALPEGLQRLDCANNRLPELPALPDRLEGLNCSGNLLESIPDLSVHLKALRCRQNLLTALPSLPSHLEVLDCAENKLTHLQTVLPSIRSLDCSFNKLESVPQTYFYLEEMICSGNNIKELPVFPIALRVLRCDRNNLTRLPKLPEMLSELDVSHNQLTKLPSLPRTLFILAARDNPWGRSAQKKLNRMNIYAN